MIDHASEPKLGENRGNAGKGRPKGVRNRLTDEMLDLASEGETPVSYGLRILRSEDSSDELKLKAAQLVAPYLHPRPTPLPRTVEFDLPDTSTVQGISEAIGAILAAAAAGQLAPSEAKDLCGLLDARLKALEIVTLEERIAKLEARSQQ